MRCEEITQLIRSNEEMKQSWNQMTTANSDPRSRFNLVGSTFTSEQRDASTRLSEDLRLGNALAACLARETVWKQQLQAATVGDSTVLGRGHFL